MSDIMGFGEVEQFENLTTRLEGSVVGGTVAIVHSILRPVSAIVSGIHGYRRNHESWGAALGWAALGFLFPVITPVVALAQGYAKEKQS